MALVWWCLTGARPLQVRLRGLLGVPCCGRVRQLATCSCCHSLLGARLEQRPCARQASAFIMFPDIYSSCRGASILRDQTAVDAVEMFDRASLRSAAADSCG